MERNFGSSWGKCTAESARVLPVRRRNCTSTLSVFARDGHVATVIEASPILRILSSPASSGTQPSAFMLNPRDLRSRILNCVVLCGRHGAGLLKLAEDSQSAHGLSYGTVDMLVKSSWPCSSLSVKMWLGRGRMPRSERKFHSPRSLITAVDMKLATSDCQTPFVSSCVLSSILERVA